MNDHKPAFCATCVEETTDLKRCIRKGKTVWLCKDCNNPLGILAECAKGGHAFGSLGSGNRHSRSGGGK